MSDGVLTYLVHEANKSHETGKKAVQKLTYFVEARGVALDFPYVIHFYGPYSRALAEKIDELTFEGALDCEPDGQSVLVRPGPAAGLVMLEDHKDIEAARQDLDFVIANFANRSPMDLEILSTVHFVANQEGSAPDADVVTKEVLELKGSKFTPDKVEWAVSELRKLGMISLGA